VAGGPYSPDINPTRHSCPNPQCAQRGRGGSIIVKSSDPDQPRLQCTTCGATFSPGHDGPYYRLRREVGSQLLTVVCRFGEGASVRDLATDLGLSTGAVQNLIERASEFQEHVLEELRAQPGMDEGRATRYMQAVCTVDGRGKRLSPKRRQELVLGRIRDGQLPLDI